MQMIGTWMLLFVDGSNTPNRLFSSLCAGSFNTYGICNSCRENGLSRCAASKAKRISQSCVGKYVDVAVPKARRSTSGATRASIGLSWTLFIALKAVPAITTPRSQPTTASLMLCALRTTRETPTPAPRSNPTAAPIRPRPWSLVNNQRNATGSTAVAKRVCPEAPVKSSAATPNPNPRNTTLLATVKMTPTASTSSQTFTTRCCFARHRSVAVTASMGSITLAAPK